MASALVINMRFPIDYEAYTNEEIAFLVDFLHRVELVGNHQKKDKKLLEDYQTFQSILNNKSEEKAIDKAFEKTSGVSIYKLMQSLKE